MTMTTLEEIFSSKRANRAFWNGEIQADVAFYRGYLEDNRQAFAETKLATIKEELEARKRFKYLKGK